MSATKVDVKVVAATSRHPERVLTNTELEEAIGDLAPGWISKHLGIDGRRVAAPHESVTELGREAFVEALDRAGWAGETVDAVICSTALPDDVAPATASLIAEDIATTAVAFDLNAACAGGLLGIGVGQSLLTANPGMRRIAVSTVERPTAWIDYQDPHSCVFWGDSAGCVLLERDSDSSGFVVAGLAMENENSHARKVRVRRNVAFHHDGRYAYGMVVKLTSKLSHQVLAEAGVSPTELRAFVGHQSNRMLLQELSDVLGVPFERQWHNVEWAGNQTSSGVITAFAEGWERDRADLEPGDHALLSAVGAGFAAAAVLLRWAP